MQLTLNIKDESVLDKLIVVLEGFRGVEVARKPSANKQNIYTKEYIDRNWTDMLSNALVGIDADSDQWKLEYGDYLAKKHK